MERKEGLPIYWRTMRADRRATWTRVEEDREGHEEDAGGREGGDAEAALSFVRRSGPREYLGAY